MGRTLKEYDTTVLKSEDLTATVDFDRVFGRPGAVHVEIGSGKGTFLVAEAKAHPETNFLGIEWASKYCRYAADRLGRWGLTNVRITRADAAEFVREYIPNESVDAFHIYFPDPWPKKKHHKRRFVQQSNMEMVIECLKSDGILQLATDHEGYFEQMQEVVSALDDRLEEIEFSRPAGAGDGELTGTNYERKYIRDRRTIHAMAFRKKPA